MAGSLHVKQIILEGNFVEKKIKLYWGPGRNVSIYMHLLWSKYVFSCSESILETWNSQVLIIYGAPWKETIYSAGAI